MRSGSKIALGYFVVFSLVYGFAFLGYYAGAQTSYNEVKQEIKELKHDPVKHTDKVENQDVSTTYHDYIVVTRNGKVAPNGVLHKYNCKCKKNENKK